MKSSVRSIKIWPVLVIFLVSLPLSAYLLRQNNLRMIELRETVVKIDTETGDINKVQPALEELRAYILTHMNTSLSAPLELPGSYNRAVEQARKKAEQSGSANGGIYKKAEAVCADPNVLLSVRAQCIQDYVTANAPAGSDPAGIEFPPKELFSYNFSSPVWSFDLAGLSVMLTVLSGLLLALLAISYFIGNRIRHLINDDPLE